VIPGRRAVHESFVRRAGSRRPGCRCWRPLVVFTLLATDAVLDVQARRDERHCASGTLDRTRTRCKPQALSAPRFASTRPAWHRFSSSTPGCLLKRHQPGTDRVGTHWPPCQACLAHPDTRHRSTVHLHSSWKPPSLSDPRADQESLCASPAVGCTLGWGRRAGLGCIPGHHYRRPCTR
jgi:hypothetical protein